MKFRPLHDHVLVKRFESEEEEQGGIIIPDTAPNRASPVGGRIWPSLSVSGIRRSLGTTISPGILVPE